MTVQLVDQRVAAGQLARRPKCAGLPAASRPLFSSAPPMLLLLVLLVSAVAPGTVERYGLALAIAGGLLGVPHGAVDHLVLGWSKPGRRTPSVLAVMGFAVAYAGLAAAAATALIFAPAISFGIALGLSALHFGRGEIAFWAERSGAPVPSGLSDALPSIAHGAVVVGLLIWGRQSTSTPVLAQLSPHLSAGIVSVRTIGLCAVAAAVIAAVGQLLNQRRYREAAELLVVALTFAVVPPLAAFGVYFGGWHALRHTARLLDIARLPTDAGWNAGIRRLACAAALPTLAAFGAMAVLWKVAEVAGIATVIAVLLALTVPHAVVVAAMDRTPARSRGDRPRDGGRSETVAVHGPSVSRSDAA